MRDWHSTGTNKLHRDVWWPHRLAFGCSSTPLAFDTESGAEYFDYSGLHSTTTQTSRLTAPVSGLYFIYGQASIAADPDNDENDQALGIRQDGTGGLAGMSTDGFDHPANGASLQTSTVAKLTAGQYVELEVYQANNDADGLNVEAASSRFGNDWLVGR